MSQTQPAAAAAASIVWTCVYDPENHKVGGGQKKHTPFRFLTLQFLNNHSPRLSQRPRSAQRAPRGKQLHEMLHKGPPVITEGDLACNYCQDAFLMISKRALGQPVEHIIVEIHADHMRNHMWTEKDSFDFCQHHGGLTLLSLCIVRISRPSNMIKFCSNPRLGGPNPMQFVLGLRVQQPENDQKDKMQHATEVHARCFPALQTQMTRISRLRLLRDTFRNHAATVIVMLHNTLNM